MIAGSLVAEGSLSPSLFPHMSFEPFLKGGMPPVPEFLRPLPKPAPLVPRYNGASRLHKDDAPDDTAFPSSIYNSRLFPPPPPHFSPYPLPGPYGSLYPGHYTPFRDRLPPTPNPPPPSPLERFPGPGPRSPHYSPPTPAQPQAQPPVTVKPAEPRDKNFKVPSGKEGSLKHRILTRPSDKKKKAPAGVGGGQEHAPLATNNNTPTPSFNKGSLIQLASGELRKVEDMRTEDFVSSAEKSPALRLDPSTVVRIDTSQAARGYSVLTLSYGDNHHQVEFESTLGHPYFVYGQGWASCDPERTLKLYGLSCHQLQVGDICISLSPRGSAPGTCQGKKRRWSAPDQYCQKKAKSE